MRILATVVYTREPDEWGEPRWSRLRPQFVARDNEWEEIAEEELTALFPSEGLVYWYESPPETEEIGGWWQLQVVEKRKGRDEFEVQSASPVYHCHNFGVDEEITLRRRAAHSELKLHSRPLGPVLTQRPDHPELWIGQLEFRKDPQGTFRGPESIPTGFLEVYRLERRLLQPITSEHSKVLTLRPAVNLDDNKVGYWAAQADEHLLQGLFKRLQQMDSSTDKSLEVTQSIFASYVEAISELNLTGDDARRERARVNAARDLLERIELNHDELQEAVEALLTQPSVEEAIHNRIDEEVTRRLKELESEIQSARREKEEELEHLRSQIDEADNELNEKKREVRTLEEKASAELQDAAESIAADPIKSVAKHFVVQALVEQSYQFGRKSSFDAMSPHKPTGEARASLDEVQGALEVAAQHQGVSRRVALSGLCALLCNRPLIITGAKAYKTCRIFHQVISSGRTYETSVPGNLFGLSDLLNLPAVLTGNRDGGILRLGDLLRLECESPFRFSILLRGVNRSPLEIAFAELVTSYRTSDATSSASLPWTRQGYDSKSSTLTSVIVRSNLQLIATWADGSSSFPLPGGIATDTAVVDSGRSSSPPADNEMPFPIGNVRQEKWTEFAKSSTETSDFTGSEVPSDAVARERGLLRELRLYQDVFANPVVGMVEWIVSRVAPQIGIPGLEDLLSEISDDVRSEIENLRSSGDLSYLKYLKQGS